MAEISLPIDRLQALSQQFIADTGSLNDETAMRWGRIQTSVSALPWTMQGELNNFFAPVEQNFHQILGLRQEIGQQLAQAANVSETLEQYITSSF